MSNTDNLTNDRRHFLKTTAAALAAASIFPSEEADAQTKKPLSDKAMESAALKQALTLIRNCCLPDGAIRQNAGGDPVDIKPYFGAHAALALLAANPQATGTDKAGDVVKVKKWLDWYAKYQDKETGYINDHLGSYKSGYRDTKSHDSVDSYAAMYLLVLERYRQLNKAKPIPKTLQDAAKLALKAIESVTDNGLTWAKPDYKMKYLMDNIEVKAGLEAGAKFFEETKDAESAEKAKKMAEELGEKLPTYWQADKSSFSMALGEATKLTKAEGAKLYPDGLANLFALAHTPVEELAEEKKALWETMKKEFQPDDMRQVKSQQSPEAPAGRWLAAASAVGTPEEVAGWRKKVVQEIAALKQFDVCAHVPALSVLALTEGHRWMEPAAPAKGIEKK